VVFRGDHAERGVVLRGRAQARLSIAQLLLAILRSWAQGSQDHRRKQNPPPARGEPTGDFEREKLCGSEFFALGQEVPPGVRDATGPEADDLSVTVQ